VIDVHDWQGKTGDSWAAEWRRTDRSFAVLTTELLRRALAAPFRQALDIGGGAGELALELAQRQPQAEVVGVDLSESLSRIARERAAELPQGQGSLSFAAADATSWQPAAGFAPDLLLSRHGVMFFADPVAAFTHFHDLAAVGARLVFSCFRLPAESPFFTDVNALLPQSAIAGDADTAAYVPGPFAFAEEERITVILQSAGWTNISMEAFDFSMVSGAGPDPVEDAIGYYSTIGPAARAMAGLDSSQRAELRARLRVYAQAKLQEGQVSGRAGAWIVQAIKA